MTDPLGTARVDIVADNKQALAAIDAIIAKMVDLRKETANVEAALAKMAGGGGAASARTNQSAAQEAATAARASGSAAVTPQLQGELKNIPITVDAQAVVSQLQGAFNQHVFKIQIDTADVLRQLEGLQIRPTAGPAQAQGPAPARPAPTTAQLNAVQSAGTPAQRNIGNVQAFGRLASAATGQDFSVSDNASSADIVEMYSRAIQALGLTSRDLETGNIDATASRIATAAGRTPSGTRTRLKSVIDPLRGIINAPPPAGQASAPSPTAPAPGIAATAALSGLQLETSLADRERVEEFHRNISTRAAGGAPSSPITYDQLLEGIRRTYGGPTPLQRRGRGRRTVRPGISGPFGGDTPGTGVRFNPKTGTTEDFVPAIGNNPDELFSGFGLQIGSNKGDIVDLTPLARVASTGILSDFFKTQGGDVVLGGRDAEGRTSIPPGAQRIGAQDMLKRLIRRQVRGQFGEGVEDQLSNSFLDALIREPKKGVAPEAGAATGYFARFIAQGEIARRRPALGDTPSTIGDTTFGGTSVEAGERAALARLGGQRGPEFRTAAQEPPEPGGARSARSFEHQAQILMGADQTARVVGAREEIKRAGADETLSFLADMDALQQSLLNPAAFPDRRTRQQHVAATIQDSLAQTDLARRYGVEGGQISFFDDSEAGGGRFLGTRGASSAFKGKAGGLISSAINAVGAELGLGHQISDETATRFAGRDARVGALDVDPITGAVKDPGIALSTGDDFIEKFAQIRGSIPSNIDPAQAQAIQDAVSTATGLDPNAGVMAVTIASPLPLPVTIAGGGGAGGGGGTKPPRTGGGGSAGGDGGDGGDDEEKKPDFPLTRQLAQEKRLQQEARLRAQVDLEGRQVAELQQRENRTGEVNLPGLRLPALQNVPENQRAPELQSQATVDLERAQEKQAAADERAAKQRQAQAVRERNAQVAQTRDSLKGLRQDEDPLFGQAESVFRDREGIPSNRPLTPEENLRFRRTFGESRGIAAQRDRETRAAASAQQAPGVRTAPSERRLQQIFLDRHRDLPQDELLPEDILRQNDPVLEAQQAARASLRQARGKIPQRALSTSIVQIAENLFGGVEGPLGRIAAAEQEFGQLGVLGREQQGVQRRQRFQERRRESLSGILRDLRPGTDEFEDVTASLRELDKEIVSTGEEFERNQAAIQKQTDHVNEMAESAVGVTDIFRNLGAGFVGGVGGALVTQAVSAVAQQVLTLAQLATPTIDVALGSGQVAQRRQLQLAQGFREGGFGQTALREQFLAAGFSSGAISRFEGTTGTGASAIARAQQLNEQLELLRSEDAAQNQQAQSSAGAAAAFGASNNANLAFNLLGQQVDIGGGDSAAKILAGIINQGANTPESQARAQARFLREEFLSFQSAFGAEGEARFRTRLGATFSQETLDQAVSGDLVASFTELPGRLDEVLNQRLRDAGSEFQFEEGRDRAFEQALSTAGSQFASDLLPALRGNNLRVTRGGQGLNLEEDFPDLIEQLTGLDPGSAATNITQSVGFQNSLRNFFRERRRSAAVQQIGAGFQGLGNPILEADRLGIPGGGTREFRQEYRELASQAQAFEDQGVQMMQALMPGSAGLIDEWEMLGLQVQEFSQEANDIQAGQAMRQYALSVKQARFAVEDLTAITGRGIGSNIGQLERENMLMQRRLQTLQFEQSQRSINFGVAIAGFQAEGLTGAERGARLRVAREEAKIQQEMLDLQRGMFGNQVQIVDQRNLRQLELATDNLNNIVASFDENKRLAEISNLTKIITRQQKNIEGQWSENLQTQLAMQQMRDAFLLDVGEKTQTLIEEMDTKVITPYDDAVGMFDGSTDTLAGVVTDMQSNVVNPFSNSVGRLSTQVGRLDDLINGSGEVPGLTVRDITIRQQVTGTVVDYKQLVDLIIEELGRQQIRTGNG